jgi:hypothetical protein
MSDIFAFACADWLFPSVNTEDGEEIAGSGRQTDEIESNGPSNSQSIPNVFHAGLQSSPIPSDVNCEPHSSHTYTHASYQSIVKTSQSRFGPNSEVTVNHDLAFGWCEGGQDILPDVNTSTTQDAGYVYRNFE